MVTRGQVEEFEAGRDIIEATESQIINIQLLKTAAVFKLFLLAGAIISEADNAQLECLSEFADTLGVAFQIQDDLLNVTAAESDYGKEIGGDIREGKATLLTSAAIQFGTDTDREALRNIFVNKKET